MINNPAPRKSASLIIIRFLKATRTEYQTLLLQRNQNMSFGGMYAFPGGNCDKEDFDGDSSDWT
jgi:8-oxo-dGTP pyrophosphatase MutT (NUDIX family)